MADQSKPSKLQGELEPGDKRPLFETTYMESVFSSMHSQKARVFREVRALAVTLGVPTNTSDPLPEDQESPEFWRNLPERSRLISEMWPDIEEALGVPQRQLEPNPVLEEADPDTRDICYRCGKIVHVRLDGFFRLHYVSLSSSPTEKEVCPGSGTAPRKEAKGD